MKKGLTATLDPTQDNLIKKYMLSIAKVTIGGFDDLYIDLSGQQAAGASAPDHQTALPGNTTVSKLTVVLDVAPGAGESITVTGKKNGVDSLLKVIISDLATSGTDNAHAIVGVQEDLVCWHLEGSAGAANTHAAISCVTTL
jgi:hypothetical protein